MFTLYTIQHHNDSIKLLTAAKHKTVNFVLDAKVRLRKAARGNYTPP